MKFKKQSLPTGIAYVSTRGYKVVNYGGKWFAFFKPEGWKSFGNTCERESGGHSVSYNTRQEAEAVAMKHFEKFGSLAEAHCSILANQP